DPGRPGEAGGPPAEGAGGPRGAEPGGGAALPREAGRLARQGQGGQGAARRGVRGVRVRPAAQPGRDGEAVPVLRGVVTLVPKQSLGTRSRGTTRPSATP